VTSAGPSFPPIALTCSTVGQVNAARPSTFPAQYDSTLITSTKQTVMAIHFRQT
jgi:hypothetical protein